MIGYHCGALQLLTTGTNAELIARIKLHLTENPQLEQNHRFVGLFHAGRRRGPVSITQTSLEPTASETPVPTHATIPLSSTTATPSFPGLPKTKAHCPKSCGIKFGNHVTSFPVDFAFSLGICYCHLHRQLTPFLCWIF